jgi:hypothetical protein
MAARGQNPEALRDLWRTMHERLVVLERQRLGMNPEWNPEYEEEGTNPDWSIEEEEEKTELLPVRIITDVNRLSSDKDLYIFSIGGYVGYESLKNPVHMESLQKLPENSMDAWFIRRFLDEISTIKQARSSKKHEESFQHVVDTSRFGVRPNSHVKNFKIQVGVSYRRNTLNMREYYVSSLKAEALYYPNLMDPSRYNALYCNCFLTNSDDPYLKYKNNFRFSEDHEPVYHGAIVQLPSTR